jgi:mono/diheme cytochrome c family protein
MRVLTVFLGMLTAIFVVAACGDSGAANNAPAKVVPILRKVVPPAFKGSNPPEGLDLTSVDVIAAGKKTFESNPPNCFNCHGMGGKGDGPLGAEANPKPTDLTSAEFQTGAADDYIFWRVKTGGEGGPAGTVMTGFPGATDEEIWAVVAYVRSLKGK